MSWSDRMRFARFFGALALAGLCRRLLPAALCRRPRLPAAPVGAQPCGQLSAVDVAPIDAPGGSRLSRVSVEVRNELIFDLTGGNGGISPTHRLDVKLTPRSCRSSSTSIPRGRTSRITASTQPTR